jgi:hypothetical protein
MEDDPDDVEKKEPLLSGWMIVVIVAIVALAAVGIAALATRSSSRNSQTSTTELPVVQTTAAPATTIAATPSTVAVTTTTSASLSNFVGTWSMHDGGLVIAASGAGTITVPGLMYGGCGQTAQIQVSPASATTALVTITAIEPPSCSGVAGGFNPSGGGGINQQLGAGSTFTITIAPPGIQTSWGVKYCDQASASQSLCGA